MIIINENNYLKPPNAYRDLLNPYKIKGNSVLNRVYNEQQGSKRQSAEWWGYVSRKRGIQVLRVRR